MLKSVGSRNMELLSVPQQGQQNLTYSPITRGSEGSHHPFPTYTGDIAPGLIYGCLLRNDTKGLLLVCRSCAAVCGGDLESNCLAIPKGRPPPPGVSIQLYHSRGR